MKLDIYLIHAYEKIYTHIIFLHTQILTNNLKIVNYRKIFESSMYFVLTEKCGIKHSERLNI